MSGAGAGAAGDDEGDLFCMCGFFFFSPPLLLLTAYYV